MTWRYVGWEMAWRNGEYAVTQAFVEHYPRSQIQEYVRDKTGEELPDEAWPPPPPQDTLRMVMAAHEVRKKLASVDDVRELYT